MADKLDPVSPLRPFVREEKGNVAMLFALACLVIFPLVGFAIDYSRVIVDQHKLQMATDAAALAAAHDSFMSANERRTIIDAHLDHVAEELGREITYELTQDSEGRISLVTHLTVNTTIAQFMGRDSVNVSARADAVEGGSDIEVSMIVDITGSMSGSRITALRQAAKDLVDIVVKDDQTPYYSKLAMVPYSVAVNTGSYAAAARGAATPGKSITNATWKTGSSKKITGITKANPAVVTSNGHGFSNGDTVWISGVSGMKQVNNRAFTVANATSNTFQLSGVSSSSYSKYKKSGTIQQCVVAGCEVQVTANGHGLSDGDHVVIQNVKGMTQINTGTNATWQVSGVTTNTFVLQNSDGPNYSTYSNSGTSYCTVSGCEYFRFNNAYDGAQRLHTLSTCVTERTGTNAFTDVAPSTDFVGRGYLSSSNGCPDNTIIPLTSDKALLTNEITQLSVGGSTAGHMGAAWGWYMLSPTFGSIFPPDSRPAAYGRPKLHKFAVLMTDGDFNSSFCQGVLSRISTSGSGSTQDKINCDSENGNSFTQAQQYCTGMKNSGIIVYTVGFEVSSTALRNSLTSCATSADYAFFPSGSSELIAVFQQIGRAISEVRLVR
ncbi:TadE/TadG family type IV pilus assembly protein [Hyphomonas sp.]|uniref:TadE/TadG family type IV pilus assembly protein n=1 Tax=Hyphomonas sp. TaxID=87 RepID=UPI001E0DB6DA|nr:TadE/TadG family type IV pilus assembly protein [Hyphomonas sp.]MBU3919259.1 pilus assembly protein TadG [Alphaproteobacteria bacterium]MBU4060770.1 pilus assembly protein TadG [Alphaproteobacteria bacterium]MBU4164754.1 pilus assembly protein TadG [Alphaproteobacteria bacterium]